MFGGLIPRFQGADSVLVAASMLSATVMPHALYLHSSLGNIGLLLLAASPQVMGDYANTGRGRWITTGPAP